GGARADEEAPVRSRAAALPGDQRLPEPRPAAWAARRDPAAARRQDLDARRWPTGPVRRGDPARLGPQVPSGRPRRSRGRAAGAAWRDGPHRGSEGPAVPAQARRDLAIARSDHRDRRGDGQDPAWPPVTLDRTPRPAAPWSLQAQARRGLDRRSRSVRSGV